MSVLNILFTLYLGLNLSENEGLLEMDAKAVDAVLGHFDKYDPNNSYEDGYPYSGYNYGIEAFSSNALNEYLRDIIHWIAYPVQSVAIPNSPAAVPMYGDYEHWTIVNGAVTSADPMPYPRTNPWFTPDFTVYGFWLSDPAQDGIGKDIYITAAEISSTYFLPLVTGDKYNGKYIQIAEPPPVESSAKVEIASEETNNSCRNLIGIIQDLEGLNNVNQQSLTPLQRRLRKLKSHLYDSARVVKLNQDIPVASLDVDLNCLFDRGESSSPLRSGENKTVLSWQEIIAPQALTDSDFRQAVEESIAREFIKVEREDNGSAYYIIPFDKYTKGRFLTYAAIIIDAQTGAFKQASWVAAPIKFVPIKSAEAEALALDYSGKISQESIEPRLIWKPQGLSNSPFFPYWEINIGGDIFYVTQDGKVWESETIGGKEDEE